LRLAPVSTRGHFFGPGGTLSRPPLTPSARAAWVAWRHVLAAHRGVVTLTARSLAAPRDFDKIRLFWRVARLRRSRHPAERSFDCVRAAHRAPRGRAPLLRLRRGGAAPRSGRRRSRVPRSGSAGEPPFRESPSAEPHFDASRGAVSGLLPRRPPRSARSGAAPAAPPRRSRVPRGGAASDPRRAPRSARPGAALALRACALRAELRDPHPFRAAHRAPRGRAPLSRSAPARSAPSFGSRIRSAPPTALRAAGRRSRAPRLRAPRRAPGSASVPRRPPRS
jgi:hypothetical protein